MTIQKKGIESPFFKNRIGEKWLTYQNYEVEIIEYYGALNCTIKFEDGLILKNRIYNHIKKGQIKNPYHPSVQGIGYIGLGEYDAFFNGIDTTEYKIWSGILERGYSVKWKEKYPTYENVTVCKEWHNFQNFAKWYSENSVPGWDLDKDILIKGNKIYSSENCCFVPPSLNKTFAKRKGKRGDLSIGVTKSNNGFSSFVCIDGAQTYLGYFKTELEAFNAYKYAKENYLQSLAFSLKGTIKDNVYNALINYKVEITD